MGFETHLSASRSTRSLNYRCNLCFDDAIELIRHRLIVRLHIFRGNRIVIELVQQRVVSNLNFDLEMTKVCHIVICAST